MKSLITNCRNLDMLLCSIKIRNRNINRPPIFLHDKFRSHIAKALQQQGIDDTWFFFNFFFFYVPYPSSALAIIALYKFPFLVATSNSDLFPTLRFLCFAICSLKLAKYITRWLPLLFFPSICPVIVTFSKTSFLTVCTGYFHCTYYTFLPIVHCNFCSVNLIFDIK